MSAAASMTPTTKALSCCTVNAAAIVVPTDVKTDDNPPTSA